MTVTSEIPARPGPSVRELPSGAVEMACFDDHGVFSVTHLPAGTPHGGVVVTSPILAEQQKNYRREVLVARALADAGVLVRRFHYPGTGNSAGDEPSSMSKLVEAATEAVEAVTARVPRVALLGTRFGSLVAAAAAARITGAPLALWDPVADGARFFKEVFRAARMTAVARGAEEVPDRDHILDVLRREGRFDVLGFVVTRDLYDDTAGLRLPDLLGPGARPVLICQLGGSGPSRATNDLVADLEELGVDVTVGVVGEAESWWATAGGGDYFRGEEGRPLTGELIRCTTSWFDSVWGTP